LNPPGEGRPGGRAKWCHFAFDTLGAPEELIRLSLAAGLPKERAVLSFLLAGPPAQPQFSAEPLPLLPIRIISDSFPLPAPGKPPGAAAEGPHYGRYGCSARGLLLIRGGPKSRENYPPGAFLELPLSPGERRDPKSGALIADLSGAKLTAIPGN
jgi:hypothetical protein